LKTTTTTRFGSGEVFESKSPTTNELVATVRGATIDEYNAVVDAASEAQKAWRIVKSLVLIGFLLFIFDDETKKCFRRVLCVCSKLPMPQRGEIVRQIGNALREKRDALGRLIALEVGKIEAEGVGEVQEYIDMCDYAVGNSRMVLLLY
jgi:acyl-CoA reductase-like NAD-dependent aldehyde dehydrogenase